MTKEQYDLLQEIDKKKARKVGSTSANQTNQKLLVNIPHKFYCTNCGNKIISSGKHYVCSEYNSHGKKGCNASSFYVDSTWIDNKIEKEIIKHILNEDVIKTLYNQYIESKNKIEIDIKDNNTNISIIEKQLKEAKHEANSILDSIKSGNIKGQALVALSDSYNELDLKIQQLESRIKQDQQPKQSRTLTYNYFNSLCHEGSRVLTHSSLAERRAFIESCIEAVTFDPVRKSVNLKLNINPFSMNLKQSESIKKLEASTFETSSEMVAGAGFEPTTFGL